MELATRGPTRREPAKGVAEHQRRYAGQLGLRDAGTDEIMYEAGRRIHLEKNMTRTLFVYQCSGADGGANILRTPCTLLSFIY